MSASHAAPAIQFQGLTPIIHVSDIVASMKYYTEVLGFENHWGIVNGFASISRDRCHFFLCEGDQGHVGSWTYIGVSDVDAVFEELQSRGAKVRHPPTNYDWACEMQVEDPDGNVLRIGSDRKPNEPNGEWLDMHGRRWIQTANRNWREVTETR